MIECYCADGTQQLAGCPGSSYPPTCEDACCAHGGVGSPDAGSSDGGVGDCGGQECSASQYCHTPCYPLSYSCTDLPAACATTPTCACLQAAGVYEGGVPGGGGCSGGADAGGLFVSSSGGC